MNKFKALAPVVGISIASATVITGLITYLNLGWQPAFAAHWARAALLAVLVMMPLGGVMMAAIGRGVDRWLAGQAPGLRRLVAAVAMGLAMEAVASAITTLTNFGLSARSPGLWLHAYVRALPIGVAMGLLMGYVVRPWVQRRVAAALLTGAPAVPQSR